MSLLTPLSLRKPVPVTTNAPVAALYAALVITGTATLLAVTAFVVSTVVPTVTLASQSSAADRL